MVVCIIIPWATVARRWVRHLILQLSIKQTWVQRWGTGPEVADLVVFLASGGASFITGVDYTIDGGRILGPRFADV